MTFSEFKTSFNDEVVEKAKESNNNLYSSFINTYVDYLINAEIMPDFNYLFFEKTISGAIKIKADGFFYDDFDKSLSIVAGCCSNGPKYNAVELEQIEEAFEFMSQLIEWADSSYFATSSSQTPINELRELISSIKTDETNISKVKLMVVCNAQAACGSRSLPGKTINNISIEQQIWGLDRLYEVLSSDAGRQEITVDFKSYTHGNGIPCIEATSVGLKEFRSFLCVIPGEALADIYDEYGSSLLEGNVRSFLSSKVAVNKKIRATILSQPEYFFAYNNGVAATASGLEFEETSEGRVIVSARDFQIINGGQTTASLSNTRYKDKADLSNIYVQMKLTEINTTPDKALELVHNISRSSNSQNKVTDADFFATHPFHVRMDELSAKCLAPASSKYPRQTRWYYERARGQFTQCQMKLSALEQKAFLADNPKDQFLSKTDFAKYRNSWAGKPQLVSKGAQTNFMKFAEEVDEDWARHEKQYNEHYFKESVALAVLFKHTEMLVTNQSWFQKGYRANIVAYSLALLHVLIKKQFAGKDLNLIKIWDDQCVPEEITEELIHITAFVYQTITDENRETVNVGQWCKRDACWEQVRKCSYKLSGSIEPCLITLAEVKEKEKDAGDIQDIANEIEAQNFVIEKGAEYWVKVRDFLAVKKISIKPLQARALTYALKMPDNIPSGPQAKELIVLLKRIIDEGFKG